MDNTEKARSAAGGCGVCSFICYAIDVSIGWVFSRVTVPDNGFALAGAIVITLPALMVVVAFLCGLYCDDCCSGHGRYCTGCITVTCGIISGILYIAGVGLFIRAMVKAGTELESPGGAIACGVFATIFAIAAAISIFASIGSINASDVNKERSENMYT